MQCIVFALRVRSSLGCSDTEIVRSIECMLLLQMHSWEREEDLRHVSLNYKLNIIHEHVFSLVIISQFDQGFLTSHKLVEIINYLIPPPCFLMNTFVIYETEVFLNFMVKNSVLFTKKIFIMNFVNDICRYKGTNME